jgi:hypothetical protein
VPLAGRVLVEDALGDSIGEAMDFGGADNESSYELIGTGDSRALVYYLTSESFDSDGNPVYPQVMSVEVGATATKPKSYIVEVKSTASASWQPLFKYIANETSLKYLVYTFASAVRLFAVRVRYRGDFYASSDDGTLTISAQDDLTGVDAIQVSHYSDFRDATEFVNADADGWTAFEDGVSIFDWKLVNRERIWVSRTGSSYAPIRKGIRFGSLIVAVSRHAVYTLGTSGSLTLRLDLGSTVSINALGIFRDTLYIGASNGLIYASRSGTSYASSFSMTCSLSTSAISISATHAK